MRGEAIKVDMTGVIPAKELLDYGRQMVASGLLGSEVCTILISKLVKVSYVFD